MNRTFSLYLDVVRFAASCLVVLYHTNQRWVIEAIVPAGNWITERNASDMEKMKAAKPSLKFNVLDDATIAKFKSQAETVYPEYTKIGGDGAQKVLDALLKDIENAKIALGVK